MHREYTVHRSVAELRGGINSVKASKTDSGDIVIIALAVFGAGLLFTPCMKQADKAQLT